MSAVGRRAAQGSFIVFVRDFIANTIALVGSIIVARVLGPEEYGLASIALIYPSMITSIAGLGLGQALTRFSSAESIRGRASEYIYSGLAVSLLSATASSLATLGLAPFFAGLLGRPGLSQGIRVLSLYVSSITLYTAFESAFLGLGRYVDTALIALVRASIRVSIAIPLALLGYGYTSILWGLSIGYSTGVALYLLLLPRRAPSSRPSLRRAWELLKYSLPLYIPTLIASPVNQAVTGFLASRASDFEMGNLSVANLLLTPIGVIGSSLSIAVFSSIPVLIGNNSRLREAVNKAILYSNTIVIPLALGLAVVSKPVIKLLYGASYSMAPLYLILLLIPYVSSALAAGAITLYANTVGDTGFTGLVTLIDIAVRAPTAMLMIHGLGILGYLATPIIVNPAVALVTIWLGRRRYGFTPWVWRNLRVALWSLSAFTPSIILSLRASWILGVAVYIAVLAVLVKLLVEKKDIEELVELSAGIPVFGGILKHVGRLVVETLW